MITAFHRELPIGTMIWPLGRGLERDPDAAGMGDCRTLGIPAAVIAEGAQIFQTWLRLKRGDATLQLADLLLGTCRGHA